MNYSSRFWLYAPLLMFLALTGWVSLHWWNAASDLNRKLDSMKGREAVPGIVIDWRSKTLSGFPFNMDLVLEGLSVKGAGAHGPFTWQSEKFAMHSLTYGRAQKVMEAAGRQRVSVVGPDGTKAVMSFLPATLHASAVYDAQGLARFDLDVVDMGGKLTDGSTFTARREQFHFRRNPDNKTVNVMVDLDTWISGSTTIQRLQGYYTLTQVSAFIPLLRGEATWPAALAAWRAQGGKNDPASRKITLRMNREIADPQGYIEDLFEAFY
jgi:hypothetical protein